MDGELDRSGPNAHKPRCRLCLIYHEAMFIIEDGATVTVADEALAELSETASGTPAAKISGNPQTGKRLLQRMGDRRTSIPCLDFRGCTSGQLESLGLADHTGRTRPDL